MVFQVSSSCVSFELEIAMWLSNSQFYENSVALGIVIRADSIDSNFIHNETNISRLKTLCLW